MFARGRSVQSRLAFYQFQSSAFASCREIDEVSALSVNYPETLILWQAYVAACAYLPDLKAS